MTTGENNAVNIQNEDVTQFLYDKTIVCPICGKESKNRTVKKSSFKVESRDSDSMIHYSGVNPSLYEVTYCTECGYAALPLYFGKATPKIVEAVQNNISQKWVKPVYPEIFDENFAVKQLMLALHNAVVKGGPDSEKGLLCLKLSWIYRLLGDAENERRFQEQTVMCFEKAYMSEHFPAAGMDEYTMQYIVGELSRRLGDEDKALSFFSKVLVSQGAPSRLKEKVRDQKDLIDKKQDV